MSSDDGIFMVNGRQVFVDRNALCSVCGRSPIAYVCFANDRLLAYQCSGCASVRDMHELMARRGRVLMLEPGDALLPDHEQPSGLVPMPCGVPANDNGEAHD
jgi:hypothetical protein